MLHAKVAQKGITRAQHTAGIKLVQSLVSRQHIRLNLHTVVIIDFDLILGIYFT